jgi:SAM-dependent methyltransferase
MRYKEIVAHYEYCLDRYGDNHLGVDWPRKEDVIKRYQIMLELVSEMENKVSILDFGCGAGHLFEYILSQRQTQIDYFGLDISEKFITLCRSKYPNTPFYCIDILNNDASVPCADYIVMNGVFTEKHMLSYEEMTAYFQSMLKKVFPLAKKGLAFNVMSKQVDWERSDLFHLPLDEMASFITKNLSRHFVIRNDYGLYEYTVYLYRSEVARRI